MQVDTLKVIKLRRRAVKCLRQNGSDSRIVGETIKQILDYLGLWEDERGTKK